MKSAASRILYAAAKKTWKNRKGKLGEVIVPFDDFSGIRAINVSALPEGTLMNINLDGIGTKVELAERMNEHTTIAYDLVAMVCDDAVVRGGEPVLIGSILDVNTLKSNKKTLHELAEGYVSAANDAGVTIINGEIAELGGRIRGYGKFNYNWGAVCLWFANEKRMLTGKGIKNGDCIVGFSEKGFRSNGLTLARNILSKEYGDEWHKKTISGKKLIDAVLEPSRIYCRAVVDMMGGYDPDVEPKARVHGVVHVTGGGIPEKLSRVLKPSDLGAAIDSPLQPCWSMTHCQKMGKIPDRRAYEAWNMGNGMLIITPEPEKVMQISRGYGIESRIMGSIVRYDGIIIKSAGVYSNGKEIRWQR